MSDAVRTDIFPALRYREAEAALKWLQEAFGLVEKSVYRDDTGTIAHAVLRLGTGLIMFGQHQADGWLGGGTADPLASTISLYAVVDDPDAHYAQAKAAGATIVRELADMDYGSREYSARDLEGNLWSFGTYNPYT
jgi:uncharacterized glyoxalase superfamily protein PhnB